ncbi:uncharacterized protein [Eurosta solidaginis]|uniref:uncharacterized protein n=1 Tax=Eurosta solidaginis TaxID=178769 RepID=UPI003530C6A7
MMSQRFLTNYRCDCYGRSFCNCAGKSTEATLFMENVYDVSETLAQIMVICGIHEAKAKAAIDVIIYSFIHYDEIRHRIDAVPRKRLCKEDLIHDLGRKCLMNRMEAQLTYSIIKRAFKAFYHGTSEGGIRNPELEAQLIHSQECLWVHAAKRTAQIFASYEGMFFSAQKNYESLIKCVYKKLYDRMKSRSSPHAVSKCSCDNCIKRTVTELPKPSKSMYSIHDSMKDTKRLPVVSTSSSNQGETCDLGAGGGVSRDETTTESRSSTSLNLPRCNKCNCPRLICDCNVNKITGVDETECSQGPYQCVWERVDDDDEDLKEKCLELPEDHECPIDCDGQSDICDSECECDCDNCECDPAESPDDDDDDVETVDGKGEEEELINEATTPTQCNISENSVRYDDCRVPKAHVIEEMIGQPKTMAKVSGHKLESSMITTKLEVEPKVNEDEAINKLLGSMI